MTRVELHPAMLRWARERAGVSDVEELVDRFPKLPEWEAGETQPTLKQLDSFARAVHVPIGYLLLDAPPAEPLPIPDFRVMLGRTIRRPSPDLLDTLYACQERQTWYRDFAVSTRENEVKFVGTAEVQSNHEAVAAEMARTLGFHLQARDACSTWEDALRLFVRQAEGVGVLVMVNGVVGNNTHRALNPEEFRGFALADRLAPLVFVNGADSKAAQIFTLAHELAHLWVGSSAVSDASVAPDVGNRREEVWCNRVAAELLVPIASLRLELTQGEELQSALTRLARRFKVSRLVILRRLLDARWLDRDEFDVAWRAELGRLSAMAPTATGGGDFYRTTLSRVGRRFARALVESTLEGLTLYRDAFRMLGVSKTETFDNISREVGVVV